ncbi:MULTISPECIES: hypothetical protein [Bacillus]|uniref:hypothetical protein n=1 Tax=Bacillus TaxID=1386 RepID=UPI0015968867|nr:hypothetical protein [Bacillus mycoides]HDR7635979.1 hypothetical protein [Bacillus mycoides]
MKEDEGKEMRLMDEVKIIKVIEIEGNKIQFITGKVWAEPSCDYVPIPSEYLVK